jgi:hypothetical protein
MPNISFEKDAHSAVLHSHLSSCAFDHRRIWMGNSPEKNSDAEPFDVFLSYNSGDRPQVVEVYKWLRKVGLKPWLDIYEARPGLPWQDALQHGIEGCKSVVVFIGCSGLGPWEVPEMNAALREQVDRKCPVIPVLLPGLDAIPELPLFLRGNTWVAYSGGLHDATARSRLYWGITGRRLDQIADEGIPDAPSTDVGKVFLANVLSGKVQKLFESVLRPALKDVTPLSTPEDLGEPETVGIAQRIEKGVAQAQMVLFVLCDETPFVPLPLQVPLQADKKLIVILESGIELPEALSYGDVLNLRQSRKALDKLGRNLELIVSAALVGDRLMEAERLLRLGFPESAVIAAANHLYDFLRNHAVSHFGYKYFHEKPIRYYSMSELFRLLFKKGKLQTHAGESKIDWRKLVQLRNLAAHGSSRGTIGEENATWYIRTVRQMVLLNTE